MKIAKKNATCYTSIMEPTPRGAQIALFYRPVYIGSNTDVPGFLRQNFGQDIQINLWPIPQDAPAEIPRLEASLNNLSFQFSNVRADIITTDTGPTPLELTNFFNTVLSFNTPITRIGYVLKKSFNNVNENQLREHFHLDADAFPDINEVAESSWRVNKIQSIAGGECNNIWTLVLEASGDQTNIFLERDVNTTQNRTDLNITDLNILQNLALQLRTAADQNLGIIRYG